MHETDLHLDPNEASDLCPVLSADARAARGWDLALLTVLDEAPAERAIAILSHDEDAPHGEGWDAHRIDADPVGAPAGKTEDAEACAQFDGRIYLMGSQFGKKAGPLNASRSWIARVDEGSLSAALDGGRAELEVVRTRFGLHRALNDAVSEAGVELIALGDHARRVYIDDTIAIGRRKKKRWAGRVEPGDYPFNIEAMEFRANGDVLLGVRYPVTSRGQPLLIELCDIDAIFDDPDVLPSCRNVWVLDDVGDPAAPAGIRALHTHGDDVFDAVVGDLDAPDKGATVLEDHPEGREAPSRHVSFRLPPRRAGGVVSAETIHDFGDVRRVEGIVVDDGGHAHYVLDEEGRVALRTLLFD
jgi:hypothetical protein